ncbi:cbb3-type cytochrome c oxidase subunit I [Puia sp.]|jgi:cytochrome c oxidase cbb3-type subunit 1|uniref:cbb3-type cytochrome c oxidase subunit I n=1 Tax=Puia sp. TaxID=2045100 RepID=UPI002F3ECBFA
MPFFSLHSISGLSLILMALLLILLLAALYLYGKTKEIKHLAAKTRKTFDEQRLEEYLSGLDKDKLIRLLKKRHPKAPAIIIAVLTSTLLTTPAAAQTSPATRETLFTQPGIIILIILILLPVLLGVFLMGARLTRIVQQYRRDRHERDDQQLDAYLDSLENSEAALEKRLHALEYTPGPNQLSGTVKAEDTKGLIHHIESEDVLPVVPVKKRATKRPPVDPQLTRLILAYLVCAAGWLLLGTSIGEYLGIKFVAPDADHVSWLSFGRLRPVHTNMVFWGWASLGMLGLGYYIVPRVSNTPLHSIKKGWVALWLINSAVLIGSLSLMAGINNGGGEYREYTWPVMALFAIGLILTLSNFLRTVARRTTPAIYISNWYIISAIIFALVIVFVAYLPWWQDGLGETIIQGYYMHMGVGMWFMFFTLGIVYYFLPQQLNRPIYSYSLGILAFWSQILFYTVIGSHHFIFSSIPWWLQTVAIVGSVGMIIPVTAGATNFLLTINGSWSSVGNSYTLPFFLTGIVFYFTGSMQGTAEAFRSTNLIWHFTDFTVAHSHLTMYGIITFFIWAATYVLVPRLTGKEAPQIAIGAHFWLALLGLLFYTIPLMWGATLKGLLWSQGKPFIDGVVLMAPYWLWRAIGGSLMWFSHLVFAYNMYRMIEGTGVFTWSFPASGVSPSPKKI